MAQRIGDYIHTLILEDRARVQHYSYSKIGRALGLEPQQVEAAIGDGNYTGVTFFGDPAHRNVIASQLKPKSHRRLCRAARARLLEEATFKLDTTHVTID